MIGNAVKLGHPSGKRVSTLPPAGEYVEVFDIEPISRRNPTGILAGVQITLCLQKTIDAHIDGVLQRAMNSQDEP